MLALVIAAVWASAGGTLFGAWVVATSGTVSLIALAFRLTPRWGRPAACSLRGPLAALTLVLIAAARVGEHDTVGALLQGLGAAAVAMQTVAAVAAAGLGLWLIQSTRRDERAGHGPTC